MTAYAIWRHALWRTCPSSLPYTSFLSNLTHAGKSIKKITKPYYFSPNKLIRSGQKRTIKLISAFLKMHGHPVITTWTSLWSLHTPLSLCTKGQLISKAIFLNSNSSKKQISLMNSFFLPNSTMVELFRSFFGGI